MRELTKSEKILLMMLGVVAIGLGSLNFIIDPQIRQLEALSTQKLEYQNKLSEMAAVIQSEDEIDANLDQLGEEKKALATGYFSKLDQAQITYLLNDLLARDDFTVLDMNINKPDYEALDEFQVKKMEITIAYEGSYMGVMDTIRALKNSPRKILVDRISMDKGEDGRLMGDMALKIYGLDHIADEVVDVIIHHGEKRNYGSTPFSPYESYLEYLEGEEALSGGYNPQEPDRPSDVDNPLEPGDSSGLGGPTGPGDGLNPYSPEYSVDYEKDNTISTVPGLQVK